MRFLKHFPEKVAEELSVMQNKNPCAMALATESAILNITNISTLLSKIICPTLFVCGQDDTATPIEVAAEMKAHIAYSEIEVIPQSVRHIPIENPKELNHKISNFLN